jgi:hypothetical protein
MRTSVLALFAAAVLAGCGAEGDRAGSPPPPPPTVTGPADPPPEIGREAPPPAWIETEHGAFWLGYSTYCWKTVCADYIAPRCGDELVPTVVVAPGETVRFHLGFDPVEVVLASHLRVEREGESARLESGRTPSWRVTWAGATSLFARAAPGQDGADASYAVCLENEALTVAEAVALGEGEVTVRGPLWADGDDVRLCDAVAESCPPQCPSGYLKVRGLDLGTIDGLNEASGVRWTDDNVRLTGTLEGDVLHVRG